MPSKSKNKAWRTLQANVKAMERKALKKKKAKALPKERNHWTCTVRTPDHWMGQKSGSPKAGYCSVTLQSPAGMLVIVPRINPKTGKDEFSIQHTSFDYIMNKCIVKGSFDGKTWKVAPKTAKAQIAQLNALLRGLLGPLDAFTDAAHSKGEKNASIWFGGVPIHCKCGMHKTKSGYTCKDLHDAMSNARGSLEL